MATKKAPSKKAAAPVKEAAATKVAAKKTAGSVEAATKGVPATKMTKTQVVGSLAEQLQVPNRQIATFFDAMVQMAVEQTRTSGEFTIPGLGKLVKAERQARVGRNPATGEAIKIAAKTTVKFRIAKAIKDSVVPAKK